VAKETGIESHDVDVVLRSIREIRGFEKEVEITLYHNDDFVLEIAGE
jgi:phosphopantetheine adenylyltransferase